MEAILAAIGQAIISPITALALILFCIIMHLALPGLIDWAVLATLGAIGVATLLAQALLAGTRGVRWLTNRLTNHATEKKRARVLHESYKLLSSEEQAVMHTALKMANGEGVFRRFWDEPPLGEVSKIYHLKKLGLVTPHLSDPNNKHYLQLVNPEFWVVEPAFWKIRNVILHNRD